MPHINLIREQRATAIRSARRGRAAFAALAASLVAGVGVFGFLTYLVDAEVANESKLRAEKQRLEPFVLRAEANRKELETLRPRLATLEEAQAQTSRWLRILHHLVGQTPKGTWLTSLRSLQGDKEKPIELSLAGLSASQAPIGELMLRTQGQRDLDAVTLRFTQEKQLQAARAIEFEISALVKGTEEKQPEKKEDKAS